MKKLLIITLLFSNFSSFAIDDGSDKIIKKYLKAIGGAKEWDKINTLKMVLQEENKYVGESITAISILRDKGYKRERVTDFKNTEAKGFQGGTPSIYVWCNDETAWSVLNFSVKVDDKKVDSSFKALFKKWGTNQILDKSNDKAWTQPLKWQTQMPWCFINYENKGDKATYKGDSKINIDEVSEVEMISATGDTANYFFDKKRAFLLRAVYKKRGYSYSDFKQVDNVKVPFEINEEMIDALAKQVSINRWYTVVQVKLNEPIDEKIFMKPKQ